MVELCTGEDVKVVYSCIAAFTAFILFFESLYFAELGKKVLNIQTYSNIVL